MSDTSPQNQIARRLLFISSVVDGGSGSSQRELASAVAETGREVTFLVDAQSAGQLRRRVLAGLEAASARDDSKLSGGARGLASRIGARTSVRMIDGLRHELTVAPENAFAAMLGRRRTDVVVISSVRRRTWRHIRSTCRRRSIPTLFYLRDPSTIGHLAAGLTPDLVLATSGALVDQAERLGHRAELLPSGIDVEPMGQPSTREVALIVNPRVRRGLHIVGPLSAVRPDIPFVLQEAARLDRRDREEISRLVRDRPNVAFRAFDPRPGLLFRDARVVLAPGGVDHRSRVTLAAQANGLPVLALGQAGRGENDAEGGHRVNSHAGVDGWARSLGEIWDDERTWMRLSDRARIEARSARVKPDVIAAGFLGHVDALVEAMRQNSSMSPSANRN